MTYIERFVRSLVAGLAASMPREVYKKMIRDFDALVP